MIGTLTEPELSLIVATRGVVLQELSRPEDLHWLADFERCAAWTLLEMAEEGAGA